MLLASFLLNCAVLVFNLSMAVTGHWFNLVLIPVSLVGFYYNYRTWELRR